MEYEPDEISPNINRMRREDRDLAEMLGLAKGVIADGVVTDCEAKLLQEWITAHPDAASGWPGSVLSDRLEAIFADGHADEEERQDLCTLLEDLVGGRVSSKAGESFGTKLPFDSPEPAIQFKGSVFIFTGKMVMGPRKACEALVIERGGICGKNLSKKTDFLVVGTFGSRDWIQTSHGRKIEKAVAYRESGAGVSIVSEELFASAI